MRLRDLQQILSKFTNGQKGTVISDCPIYIETKDGYLEEDLEAAILKELELFILDLLPFKNTPLKISFSTIFP